MVRNLMYASRSKSVHTVIVDGRVVLDAGRFPHLDEPALLAQIDAASRGLLERMGFVVPANRVGRALRSGRADRSSSPRIRPA